MRAINIDNRLFLLWLHQLIETTRLLENLELPCKRARQDICWERWKYQHDHILTVELKLKHMWISIDLLDNIRCVPTFTVYVPAYIKNSINTNTQEATRRRNTSPTSPHSHILTQYKFGRFSLRTIRKLRFATPHFPQANIMLQSKPKNKTQNRRLGLACHFIGVFI